MYVASINTFPKYNQFNPVQNAKNNSCNVSFRPQLSQDTVSFTGYRKFLELPNKELFSRLIKSLSDDMEIGRGGEAVVYSIPGTKYCLRCIRGCEADIDDLRSHIDFNLTEADKVNNVVAHLGAGATILNRLKGMPVKAEFMTTRQIKEVASTIADFPVQSFRTLLHQIVDAEKKNMYFDNFWPNVIVNEKNKSLTAIDFVKDYKYAEEFAPLTKMYDALTHDESTPEQIRSIANKILNAALKDFAPKQKPCMNVEQYDFAWFLTSLRNSERFNISDANFCALYKAIERIVELKGLELNGENVTNMLRNDLNVAKEIIDLMF